MEINYRSILLICVVSLTTILLRFSPFIVFKNKSKQALHCPWLTDCLPKSIIAVLVVYCLKDIFSIDVLGAAFQIVACGVVAISYRLKRNIVISMTLGTGCYMLLLALV